MALSPPGNPRVFDDPLDALRNQLDYARRRGIDLERFPTSKWHAIKRAEGEIIAQRMRLVELNAVLQRVYKLTTNAPSAAISEDRLREIQEIVGFAIGRRTEPLPSIAYPPHDIPPLPITCEDCQNTYYSYDVHKPQICRACRMKHQDEGRR